MRRFLRAAGLGLGAALTAARSAPAISFEHQVQPLLDRYCYDCHGDGMDKGGVALDAFDTAADVRAGRRTWEAVLRHVTRREMPPEDATSLPTAAERETIARFVEHELYQLEPDQPDPGRAVLRRMNRAEYRNAVRDLVGVDFDANADFPPDDSGYGFDNIGDALSLPPVLLEKYLAAADQVLDDALVTEPVRRRVTRVPASLAKIGFNAVGDRGDGWVHLISLEEDDVAVELPILATGDYLVRFQAFSTREGGALVGQGSDKALVFPEDPGPTRIALALNDTFVTDFAVTRDESHPGIYEARVAVPAGRQIFRAVMRRKRGGPDELKMLNGRLGTQQPGIVFVKWMEVDGPLPAATQVYPGADEARAAAAHFTLAHAGNVILRAEACADQAGQEPARMDFRIDGRPAHTWDVLAPAQMQPLPGQHVFSPQLLAPQPEVYELRVALAAGAHVFSAGLVNPYADPGNANPNLRRRRLFVRRLTVTDPASPVIAPPPPPPLRALLARFAGRRSPADARALLSAFAGRAWRRPPSASELDRLEDLYRESRAQGDSFVGGIKLAFKAAMTCPQFLFVGAESAGDRALPGTGRVEPLDDYALASRLSFFLWSSVPDDTLLALASRGQLRPRLDAQVRRMLVSPKAEALVDNFAGQWLQIRTLDSLAPDHALFPEFDSSLRAAMRRETELLFDHVMRENRSVFDFLTADYTYANARLARFYGLPPPPGDGFERLSLAGTPRRGLLTQASILTLTSNPTRTSPVKRGKWVLENLLGSPPPPAPPNLPSLDDKNRHLTGSLREQMRQHRTDASCASCHARMDPIGFALEHFDGVGAWRDADGSMPIDPSGRLVGGGTFSGAAELVAVLAQRHADDFRRCLAEKMLTYALGRGVEYYDRPAVERIMADLQAGQDTFSALILGVAHSFPFQYRRCEPPSPPPS